jgi:uncharacterized protein
MNMLWNYLFVEPLRWFFYCFFQPIRFSNEVDKPGLLNLRRVVPMLRIAGIMLIFLGPVLLTIHFLLLRQFTVPLLWSALLIFMAATGTGIVIGIIGGCRAGITGGFALGITFVLVNGLQPGLAGSAWTMTPFVFAIVAGISFGVAEGSQVGIASFAVGGIALGLTYRWFDAVIAGVALGIAGFIALSNARVSCSAFRFLAGTIIGSLVGFLFWLMGETLYRPLTTGSFENPLIIIATMLLFLICYILGYYRLPLYLISAPSVLRAYFSSYRNPKQVFIHLHNSALYWDERIYLPLPKLKRLLLLAAVEDRERTLDELAFIAVERPSQIAIACSVLIEMTLSDLEMRDSLRDMASASEQLVTFLSQKMEPIDPRWIATFFLLDGASRDAARYCSPLGLQARSTALQNIVANLSTIRTGSVSTDVSLSGRLEQVVQKWIAAAQYALKELERKPELAGSIANPYMPGTTLKLRDSLFVGRRDLAQQLGYALDEKRRLTFLLHGERRMGKSSTLKQLPNLLGARYLPVFFDLQTPSISSSAVAFLSDVSKGIYDALSTGGMRVRSLDPQCLKDARLENEAAIYYPIDEWLDEVERVLETADRIVLLTFDEFEQLEEAGLSGRLNLYLLLNWFRNVIQNRSKIALLFSGIQTFAHLGANWSSHFVSVQTLRVSFLEPDEAYRLITRPAPHFPSEQIFGEHVVEAVIKETGCHPFLVQALCSTLIELLNTENRGRSELHDVDVAVQRVFSKWENYFQDLWMRTGEEQKKCLIALGALEEATLPEIEREARLDRRTMRRTLTTLVDRDLVSMRGESYTIATPIFSKWIALNADL